MASPSLFLSLFVVACAEEEDIASFAQQPHPAETGTNLDTATADTTLTPGSGEVYGPENDWWHTTTLPDGLAGTGWKSGNIAHNFTLLDQDGSRVELYQFYGQVIVLDLFVGWCSTCEDIARVGQDIWEDHQDKDFVFLSVMLEDSYGNPPDGDDITQWASRFGLTHPLLQGPDSALMPYIQVAYPTIVVIDRDMRIRYPDFWPLEVEVLEALLN